MWIGIHAEGDDPGHHKVELAPAVARKLAQALVEACDLVKGVPSI